MERRARPDGGRDRHRRSRRVDGLLGATVRDARLGRGAARCSVDGRRPSTPPPVCGGRLCVLRRTARGGPYERPPGHRTGGRGLPLRPVRARLLDVHRGARSSVYCGDLDRYLELTGAGGRALRQRARLRPRILRRRPPVERVASRRHVALAEQSVAAARELGNPYWIAYALWIAGMAFSEVRLRDVRWPRGTRASTFVRRAPRAVPRGLPRPRDAGTPAHHRRRARGRRWCCSPMPSASFQRAGNVPQLVITLASVPGAVRTARAVSRRPRLSSARSARARVQRPPRAPSSPGSAGRLGREARKHTRRRGPRSRRAPPLDLGAAGRLRTSPADRRRAGVTRGRQRSGRSGPAA